jgi:hypothetical protein
LKSFIVINPTTIQVTSSKYRAIEIIYGALISEDPYFSKFKVEVIIKLKKKFKEKKIKKYPKYLLIGFNKKKGAKSNNIISDILTNPIFKSVACIQNIIKKIQKKNFKLLLSIFILKKTYPKKAFGNYFIIFISIFKAGAIFLKKVSS